MSDGNRYDLVTLDVYAALFDFAGSLAPVVRHALGAKRAGLTCVLSNRSGGPPLVASTPPDVTLPTLSGLAEIVAGGRV